MRNAQDRSLQIKFATSPMSRYVFLTNCCIFQQQVPKQPNKFGLVWVFYAHNSSAKMFSASYKSYKKSLRTCHASQRGTVKTVPYKSNCNKLQSRQTSWLCLKLLCLIIRRRRCSALLKKLQKVAENFRLFSDSYNEDSWKIALLFFVKRNAFDASMIHHWSNSSLQWRGAIETIFNVFYRFALMRTKSLSFFSSFIINDHSAWSNVRLPNPTPIAFVFQLHFVGVRIARPL